MAPDHHRPGGYRNPWPTAQRADPKGGILRWMIERRRRGPVADAAPGDLPRVVASIPAAEALEGTLAATWLGHSTVLVQVDGLAILTDPVWARRASPFPFAGPRRWVDPPVAIADLPAVDLVLQSHNHYDHFDLAATRELARRFPDAIWCVPLGLADPVRRCGVRRVEEMDWWEEREVEAGGRPVRVTCTPAQHFSARFVHDRDRTLWCGWVARTGRASVYYSGDTGHHPEFGGIARRLGPFDLAILPVGAYEPRWFMAPVHMNPEDALQAWRALAEVDPTGGPTLLGVHWGTYKLTDERMDEPPRRMREVWEAEGLDPERLWLLAHGESRIWRPAT